MVTSPLPSAPVGLSRDQAAARLIEFGPNELVPPRRSASAAAWAIRLVADPMVILLVVAGATYAVLGDRFDAIVVGTALVPIFFVTSILEFRSDRALERLNDLAPPRATVLRDGEERLVPAREVVPDDLLVLREGDVIAADGRLVETSRLLVDESTLTGESLPVEKRVSDAASAAVLAGTVVRSGRGMVRVERTGSGTEYGRIGRALGTMPSPRTPIERSIRRIVVQVGFGVVLACAVVVAIERAHGDPWGAAIIAGVSLAMAAIPEELPMVYTLYLALGAWRLAKDNALVRRLASVETLGATTVICVDKTGTLTTGKLSVEAVFASVGWSEEDVLARAAAASDPTSGDPLDRAVLAASAGPEPSWTLESRIPFDPERRYAGAVWKAPEARLLVVKGAFETLAARGARDDGEAARFLEAAGGRGGRVLAVAESAIGTGDEAADASARLRLVGLISLADKIRDSARAAVATCRSAGIRVVMMTGDHPATARSIGADVGLDTGRVVSADREFAEWDDAELGRQIASIDIFARVRPEQKLRIVRALHARGEVVAMTGDGTNDALALREADIGVAMGKGGTEVARAAAALVLLDDDITTIARAVADGRRIFDNLTHAFSYLNAFHAPLLLGAFVLPLLGAPILLLPIHLIWLELIVHPTSALVFENDPPHADIMERGPRDPSRALLGRPEWMRALSLGGALAAAVVAIYLLSLRYGMPEDAARTIAMIAMLSGQIMLVFVERAAERPIWKVGLSNNPAIFPIVAGTAGTIGAAVLWPPLALALHLSPIPPSLAVLAVAVGCGSVLWTQPFIALRERR
jgi:Ca2+-transporting ATPase